MSYLIKGACKERCKSRYKCDGAIPASSTDCNTYNVLFGDESFDKSSWVNRFYLVGVSGILRIAVQSYNTRMIFR